MRLIFLVITAFFVNSCGPAKKIASNSVPPTNDSVQLSTEDEKIFTEVQKAAFQYFWDGAEPTSGLARERFHVDDVYPQNDKMVVTSGGSGFGVMALLVGIERNFITREQAVERLNKIVSFLETADRFSTVPGALVEWRNKKSEAIQPQRRWRRPCRDIFHDTGPALRAAVFPEWQ